MKKAEIDFDFNDEIFVFKITDGNLTIIPTTVNSLSEGYINGNWNIWQCFHRERDLQQLLKLIDKWTNNPELTYKELFNLKN